MLPETCLISSSLEQPHCADEDTETEGGEVTPHSWQAKALGTTGMLANHQAQSLILHRCSLILTSDNPVSGGLICLVT